MSRKRCLSYPITRLEAGRTVMQYLRSRGYSRHILISMKNHPDAVLLNGTHTYMRTMLHEGDFLQITLYEDAPSDGILPRPVPFTAVYEDDDLLVADKPAGTPVHPSIGNYENTLANGVLYYYRQKGENFVFRCINRLDRDTTGLLIIAGNALSAAVLSENMRSRTIHRTYLALAEGQTPPEGIVDLPIARKDGSVIERCVDSARGDPAVTRFRTIRDCGAFSVLELQLETGRTHQIRVHMAAIGHPLLGDSMYNPGGMRGAMCRQALHSWKLDFTHPVTGREMHFTAPVPDDFLQTVREFGDTSA